MTNDLVTPGQAAAILGVSVTRVRQHREKRRLTGRMIGHTYFYRRAEVEKLKAEIERKKAKP